MFHGELADSELFQAELIFRVFEHYPQTIIHYNCL